MSMRFLIYVLMLVGTIGCSSEAQETPPPNPVSTWQQYSPKDKAFQIAFPKGVPEEWTSEYISPGLGKIEMQHVNVANNKVLFSISYNDYPRQLTDGEVQKELNSARKSPATGSRVLNVSDIEVLGLPAVQKVTKTGPIYMVGRYFISDNRRLYNLHVGGTQDPRKNQQQLDRFFSSFQLKKEQQDTEEQTKQKSLQLVRKRINTLLYQKKWPEVVSALEELVLLEPENPETWRILGMVRARFHLDLNRANEALENAIRLKPNDYWLWHLRMSLVGYLGNDQLHRKLMKQQLQLFEESTDPRTLRILLADAVILPITDEEASVLLPIADKTVKLSTSEDGQQWAALYRGILHYRSGDFDEAINSLDKVYRKTQKENFAIICLPYLSMAQFKAGKHDEAKASLRLAEERILHLSKTNDFGSAWQDRMHALTSYRDAVKLMWNDHVKPRDPSDKLDSTSTKSQLIRMLFVANVLTDSGENDLAYQALEMADQAASQQLKVEATLTTQYEAASVLSQMVGILRASKGLPEKAIELKEKSVIHLREAVTLGFSDIDQLRSDKNFNPIRENDKFQAIITSLEKNDKSRADHSEEVDSVNHFVLEFDGRGSHVILPRTFYDGSHPITLEAWVELGEKGAGHIISNLQKSGTALELYRRYLVSNVVSNQGYFRVTSADKLTNQETHVAVVFDGKIIKLFINGKKTGEKSILGPHRPSSLAYMIGGNPQAEVGPPIDLFTGLIDEVRISRTARYDDDFTPSRRFASDKNTMGLYHFDEGEGIVAYDSSGNNFHGLIVDAKWIKREQGDKAPTK